MLRLQTDKLNLLIEKGSILDAKGTVMVNCANPQMRGGMGLNGAVHKAAGPELLAHLESIVPEGSTYSVCSCLTTKSFLSNYAYIIHAVGPIYEETSSRTESLKSVYQNSFREWSRLKNLMPDLGALYCPSISTGIYGYPLEPSARVALKAVFDYSERYDLEIVFRMYTEEEYQAFAAAFNDVLKHGLDRLSTHIE